MAAGAAPSVLQAGNGLAPFLVSMVLLAIGAGKSDPSFISQKSQYDIVLVLIASRFIQEQHLSYAHRSEPS